MNAYEVRNVARVVPWARDSWGYCYMAVDCCSDAAKHVPAPLLYLPCYSDIPNGEAVLALEPRHCSRSVADGKGGS